MSPPLLNQDEAATHLSVSPRTLEAWRVRGGGPLYVRVGRVIRYRPEDLDAWVSARVTGHTAQPAA